MQPLKAIYIDYNFADKKYPNKPGDGDSWFTHGFGGLYSRKFKFFNPEYAVECWKADARAVEYAEKLIDGVLFKIFPARSLGRIGLWSSALLNSARRQSKNYRSCVFNCSSFDHLLFYSLCFVKGKMPLVVQHHGESPARYKRKTSSGLKRFFWMFMQRFERFALKRTSLVYLLDPETENWLAGFPQKVQLQTTGVDPELFQPHSKLDARKALGLDPNKNYLLYIGKLNRTKRPDKLIDAFSRLKERYADLELLIAGCSETDLFYSKAQEAGAQIFGTIPQYQIALWMSAATIYYLPDLDDAHYFGGLGMLPVQAMLCNTPVIGGTLKCFPAEFLDLVGMKAQTVDEIMWATIQILEKSRTFDNLREVALPLYSWEGISKSTATEYQELISKACR
jgi:glycosyltransferase involved in cell wall biosynthesis